MAERMQTDDPFAFIVPFCQPTPSQLSKFPTCPLDRDSEYFEDPEPFPWSPPDKPAGIVSDCVSLNQNSVDQQAEHSAVFHTPPEHNSQSNLSSSEDQNPNEVCAGAANLRDGMDILKKVKGFQGALDCEFGSNKTRVSGKELSGGRAEAVVAEIGGTEAVDREIIVLGCQDSVGKTKAVELRKKSEDTMKGAKPKVDVAAKVSGDGKMSKDGNGDVDRRIACKRIDDIDEFRFSGWDDVGRNWKAKKRRGTRIASKRKRELPPSMVEKEKNEKGLSKGEKNNDVISNDAGKVGRKKGHLNTGTEEGRSGVVGMVEVRGQLSKGRKDNAAGSSVAGVMEKKSDKVYKRTKDGGNNVAGKAEVKGGPSLDVMEKNERDEVEKKGGLLGILDILRSVSQNLDDDDKNRSGEDVNFVETARKRGVIFPRPRWWPPEGEEM